MIIIFGGYSNTSNEMYYVNYNNKENNKQNDLKWNKYSFFELSYYKMWAFSYHNIIDNKNIILLIGGTFQKNVNEEWIISNEIWLLDFEKNKIIELLKVLIFCCLLLYFNHLFKYINQSKQKLPYSISYHASLLINESIHILGGYSEKGGLLNNHIKISLKELLPLDYYEMMLIEKEKVKKEELNKYE